MDRVKEKRAELIRWEYNARVEAAHDVRLDIYDTIRASLTYVFSVFHTVRKLLLRICGKLVLRGHWLTKKQIATKDGPC